MSVTYVLIMNVFEVKRLILIFFGFQSSATHINVRGQDDTRNNDHSLYIVYSLQWKVIINFGSIIYEKQTNKIK